MNELIKITTGNNGEQLVSARELYDFLEVTERFQQWFDKKVEKFNFKENQDYIGCKFFHTLAKQELQDYYLKIQMAKELAMLQNNDKGKQAREYFVKCEEAWNSPQMILSRALEIQKQTFEEYQKKILSFQPKLEYYDNVLQSETLIPISVIAKDLGMSAVQLNAELCEKGIQYKQGNIWLLYKKYQDKGYTHSKTFLIDNEGKRETKISTYWTEKGREFIMNLFKGDEE